MGAKSFFCAWGRRHGGLVETHARARLHLLNFSLFLSDFSRRALEKGRHDGINVSFSFFS